MNEALVRDAEKCYRLAEQKAARYFQSLYGHVLKKTYVPALSKDIQYWKQNHIHHPLLSLFYRGNRKTTPKGFHNYIQWLKHTGKLDQYLDRSISYIFLRDMGKTLDSPQTQARIRHVVDRLKTHLTMGRGNKVDTFSIAGIYRWAQKEGIESTIIWLYHKLKGVSSSIPEGMDAVHAQRKLVKIIGGVVMNKMEEMGDDITAEERTKNFDEAIRLGYFYGLTYPFIDDLLDANILSSEEKKQYSDLIHTALITGIVPHWDEWTGKNTDLLRFVHSEFQESFEYIKTQHKPKTFHNFLEQSYVFFYSQEVDRARSLLNKNYTNEEIYIPVILKSSSSRLIVRSLISAPDDEDFENRTFLYGIYNQLADDLADLFDDMKAGVVTPFTYYMQHYHQRSDLINPFELYWAVIFHLIHTVYHQDARTCEIILDRAINGLKRFKVRMGNQTYQEVMNVFTSGISKFNNIIQNMVRKADDVDFFDKLLRDQFIAVLKNQEKEQADFFSTIKAVRTEINTILNISKAENDLLMEDPIHDAANYSLKGGGKRLRPIITWVMGVNEYGLNESAIIPLVRSLEFMHTASLIFDDLPSQDNAPTRRGRPTLHQVYNIAIAELTGLFLTQKAVEEQSSLSEFDAKTVLNLIHYSSHITGEICKGQVMDLNSKGKQLTLEQLNTVSFYKTGLAFEASLVMPAILAYAKDPEVAALKKFALHAGIAFQIKDDLLDVEGDQNKLGKQIGRDAENNNSTFVSILGADGAKSEMWEHYCLAMEALLEVPRNTAFLKQLLNFIVNRDH